MNDTILNDLTLTDCDACEGEGYILELGAPHADGLPTEAPRACPLCAGAGVREVCGGCGEPPEMVEGLEVCGCVRVELAQAA